MVKPKFPLPLGVPAAAFGAIFLAPLATALKVILDSSSIHICRPGQLYLWNISRATLSHPSPSMVLSITTSHLENHVASLVSPCSLSHTYSQRTPVTQASRLVPPAQSLPVAAAQERTELSLSSTRPHFSPPSLPPSLHNVII